MHSSVTLDRSGDWPGLAQIADAESRPAAEATLEQSKALDRFLATVERRAYRIAQLGLRDHDEAMDVVQGAMLRLVRSYAARPSEEWKPLFYRILQNGIRDAQRRRKVRGRLFGWWPGGERSEDDDLDPVAQHPDPLPGPADRLMATESIVVLEQALRDLPARQREAFIYRCLEGMDVADTAAAMGCSDGSVKTHYFRALQSLRERLGDSW
jgi:RNA polymerase sigma-70 factor (ECF subfamily)